MSECLKHRTELQKAAMAGFCFSCFIERLEHENAVLRHRVRELERAAARSDKESE